MKKYYCLYCNDDKGRFDMTKTGKMVERADHFFYKPEYRCRKCGNVVNHLSKTIVREAIEQSRCVKNVSNHLSFVESNVVEDRNKLFELSKTALKTAELLSAYESEILKTRSEIRNLQHLHRSNRTMLEIFLAKAKQQEVKHDDVPDSL